MLRNVAARILGEVVEPSTIVLQLAPAEGHQLTESLVVTLAGQWIAARGLVSEHGTRVHVIDAGPGELVVEYSARVVGGCPSSVTREMDLLTSLRPSRYCESDSLGPTAHAEFAGLSGADLLAAVSSWVGTRLAYVPGASLPTDGAVRTLLARRGVCRDYAHLVVALLRALDVPARVVSVYAPGLDPMDFHAVAEAHVEGYWHVVDATALAPRGTLVRVATGRDASDTAFFSAYGGSVSFSDLSVTAVADVLPDDDLHTLVRLA